MNSFQNKLAITALTNAVARAVLRTSGQSSSYFRLRFDSRNHAQRAPEIGYLDSNSEARFVPLINPNAEIESIADLTARVTESCLSFGGSPNRTVMKLELEATEIDYRWCVSMKATGIDRATGHKLVCSHQCRVRSRVDVTALAA